MTCEICNDKHESIDHFSETLQEVNNNVKDQGNGTSNDMEEGGMGSGRNPETPGDSAGSPGPLISFGNSGSPFPQIPPMMPPLPPMPQQQPGLMETITKQIMDAKLSCRCNKNL